MSRPSPLTIALVKLAEDGRRPRCGEWGEGNPWLSEDSEVRAAAATWCTDCPVMAECADAAKQHRVAFGVWGGRDFTRRRRAES